MPQSSSKDTFAGINRLASSGQRLKMISWLPGTNKRSCAGQEENQSKKSLTRPLENPIRHPCANQNICAFGDA